MITSPVDGQVVALGAHVGEMVTPAHPLMTILPDNNPMEARLYVPTRAAGLLKTGQKVRLMVDAFPYQRFGMVDGEIVAIDNAVSRPGDVAASVELREAFYQVRVAVPVPSVAAYGSVEQLKYGMTLQSDILLEKQSILRWLLDPLFAAHGRAA